VKLITQSDDVTLRRHTELAFNNAAMRALERFHEQYKGYRLWPGVMWTADWAQQQEERALTLLAGTVQDAPAGPGEPLPDMPQPPGGGAGWTWDDVFDWYYSVPRSRCNGLKCLANMIGMDYRTVKNRHPIYKAERDNLKNE